MKKIAVIHTNHKIIPFFNETFKKVLPEIEVFHLLDESILPVARKQNGLTPNLHKKFTLLATLAEQGGANAILISCPSLSPCVNTARLSLKTPIFKIEEPAAEKVCEYNGRIGIFSILHVSLPPTLNIIKSKISKKTKNETIELKPIICSGAFDAFIAGDEKLYKQNIIEHINENINSLDVILLAHPAMDMILSEEELKNIPKPVLTITEDGIKQLQNEKT